MVRQFAAHPAAVGILLHTLQAVEHNQVRTPITQAALESFETPARWPPLFTEKQLVALAQKRVGLGPFVERPDQYVRLAGRYVPDDALDDGRLAGPACRDQRPDAIRRGSVANPIRQLFHECVTPVKVGGRLERCEGVRREAIRLAGGVQAAAALRHQPTQANHPITVSGSVRKSSSSRRACTLHLTRRRERVPGPTAPSTPARRCHSWRQR